MTTTDPAPKPSLFPDANIPTVFADGVSNFQPAPETGRFYLVRFDPAVNGKPESAVHAVAQVVMPLSAFVQTTIFFENMLRIAVADGHVTQADVDDVRKRFAEAGNASVS